MQIGMVGLGRMGGNMARRLMRGGHEVVGFASEAAAVEQLTGEGAAKMIHNGIEYTGFVQDSGEGRWTVMAAVEEGVPADVLSAALYVRFRSRQEHTFAEKVLSAMRQKFGGHIERPPGG